MFMFDYFQGELLQRSDIPGAIWGIQGIRDRKRHVRFSLISIKFKQQNILIYYFLHWFE